MAGGLKFLVGGKQLHSHRPGLDYVSATPSTRADLTTSSEGNSLVQAVAK